MLGGEKDAVAYYGDHRPASVYVDGDTVTTPDSVTYSGAALTMTDTYNDGAEVSFEGESSQNQGYAVDFNQLVKDPSTWYIPSYGTPYGTVTVEDGVATYSVAKERYSPLDTPHAIKGIVGHYYLISFDVLGESGSKITWYCEENKKWSGLDVTATCTGEWMTKHIIKNSFQVDDNPSSVFFRIDSADDVGKEYKIRNLMASDLTQMYGDGNNPTYAKFIEQFPDDYYEFTESDHRYLGTDYMTAYPCPSPDYPQEIVSRTSVPTVTTEGTAGQQSTTTIDLAGHELRSLPNGTADTLEVRRRSDGRGDVVMVQRVGVAELSDFSWMWQSTWLAWYTDYKKELEGCTYSVVANMMAEKYIATDFNTLSGNYDSAGKIGTTTYMTAGTRFVVDTGSTTETPSGAVIYPLHTPIETTLATIDLPATYYPVTTLYTSDGTEVTATVREEPDPDRVTAAELAAALTESMA